MTFLPRPFSVCGFRSVSPRRALFCLTSLAAAILLTPFSQASSLTWNSGGGSPATPVDGSGTWNTSTAWWSNGVSNSAWNNANNDTAVFGSSNGAAGTIDLGAAITAGGITFNAATSGNYTVTGGAGPYTLTLAGVTPTITANVNAGISAVIGGSAGLTKAGAGVLTLSGTNTYTNGTVISAGTLSAGANLNVGAALSSIAILNGATFQWTGGLSGFNHTWTLGSGTATIQVDGAAGLLSNGAIGFTGTGARTLALAGTTAASTLGGVLADNGGEVTSLTKNGTGVWNLAAANSYSGDTTINAGTLALTSGSDRISVASTVKVNSGATLRLDVTAGQTIGTLQDGTSGGGTISGNAIGTAVVTVQKGAFSGVLKDQNASKFLSLGKTTSDTLILTGTNNSYTGGTTIASGTLLINNVSGNAMGTGGVSLGAATLGGSGFTTATVTTTGVSSVISPGNSPGTLTLGALDATNGGRFVFELGTSQDLLNITGALTGSTASGGLIFDLSNSGGLAAGVTYTLITFGSATGLNYTDLAVNTLPSGFTLNNSFGGGGSGFNITATSLQVQFNSVPEPSTWMLLTAGIFLLVVLCRRDQRLEH
ncbi:hypothetical protein BH09VER1_BH09VER1_43120 [soil metagenome]